jgi:predicted AlkP superfamily pyrophosphatase or phosphodiesterase
LDFAPLLAGGTLADVGPSLLSALGVSGENNQFGIRDSERICLFVVDGLGWNQLRRHADAAPYLASLTGRSIAAGFPSTTVSSLSSIGTGLPTGGHGMTGYTSYMAETGHVVNWLAWRAVGSNDDLRDRLVPEVVQPNPTIWERADAAGIATTICTFSNFHESGLTRAVLRGGRWSGTYAEGDAIAAAVAASQQGFRSLVYVYVSALDLVGHMRGPDTESWREQLAIVDRIAARLGSQLPAETTLVVTADHGMVAVPESAKTDYDGSETLRDGVVALAGEPRMRYVHCKPGAETSVLATWRETLGAGWSVLSKAEAIDAGLFGGTVTDAAAARIGEVVALSLGNEGVVERRKLPRLASMPGHHGSITDEELLVPLLVSS